MVLPRASTVRWISDSGSEYVGVVEQMLIVVPYGSPTARSLAYLLAEIERMARGGTPLGLLLSFSALPILPTIEDRECIQQFLQRSRNLLSALAAVVPGEGFSAAAQRGAATAVLMFARLQQVRICANNSEAIGWLNQWVKLPKDQQTLETNILDKVAEATHRLQARIAM